jgi:opine dehydrogenase
MRVAVLGAGGIGLGMAALLCRDGHDPVLWSRSGAPGAVTATGAIEGRFQPRVATTCAAAVAGADAVVIAVPGYGHRAVMDACAPYLGDGQTVVISSHMSLSAVYLRQLCPAAEVVAWGTTLLTGRKTAPGAVWVTHVRSRLDVAMLPPGTGGLALCQGLFGDRFVDRGSLAAIALSNLNPQNHMAIALCNLTRMEKGESWKQYANTTPAVGRLMQGLDDERLAVALAYGVAVRTLTEHFRLSFGAEGETMGDMAASLAARPGDPDGPATLDSRYVLEDVPFGLWPTVCLARAAGVAVPLHEAGVHVFSAMYGRDFAMENDILPAIGPMPAALI